MLNVSVGENGIVYAYCRVSTPDQSLKRQVDNIKDAYPVFDKNIYQEKYTGTTTDRPYWNKLCNKVKSGDVIIFDSVSRMSRNADEGVELYFTLFDNGVNLYFLNEPTINTDDYRKAVSAKIEEIKTDDDSTNVVINIVVNAMNELIRALAANQIKKAFEQSEKEVKDLRKRTSEGMKAIKRKAIEDGLIKEGESPFGNKKYDKLVTTKSLEKKLDIISLCDRFNGNQPDKKCIELLHIARNSYFKYKREILQELETKTLEEVEAEIRKAFEERPKILAERKKKKRKKR